MHAVTNNTDSVHETLANQMGGKSMYVSMGHSFMYRYDPMCLAWLLKYQYVSMDRTWLPSCMYRASMCPYMNRYATDMTSFTGMCRPWGIHDHAIMHPCTSNHNFYLTTHQRRGWHNPTTTANFYKANSFFHSDSISSKQSPGHFSPLLCK